MLGDIVDNSRQLFVPPILRFTIISIVINFTFHVGYYGLMMWFPELFNRFDKYNSQHNGRDASICEVTDFIVDLRNSPAEANVCSDDISHDVFMESLITVASAIPANIIAVLGMDRLGRKFFLGKFCSPIGIKITFFIFFNVLVHLIIYLIVEMKFSVHYRLAHVPPHFTSYTTNLKTWWYRRFSAVL